MPLFGGGSKKTKFDARQPPSEFLQNAQSYSFVHNFKVHFKRGMLQALANKVDVTVNSPSPQLPSPQQVSDEFNQRMVMSVAHSDTRQRFASASFHVTNIEYKESFALSYVTSGMSPVQVSVGQPSPSQSNDSPIFCRQCGTKHPSSSRFCTACGTSLN